MLRKTLEYWYPTIGFGISISLLLWRSPSFVVGFSQDISSAFFTILSIASMSQSWSHNKVMVSSPVKLILLLLLELFFQFY